MGKKLTTEEFVEKARKVHGDRYDYSKVEYTGCCDRICIICLTHGEFIQQAYVHLDGSCCPRCSIEKRAKNQTSTTEKFIEKAKKVHGNLYNYSLVDYKNCRKLIKILCNECKNIFYQFPYQHLQNHGCPKCAHPKNTTDEFIKKAKKTHKNKYNYSKVNYKGTHNKVIIICPKHGEFYQSPANHINGDGCPTCSPQRKLTTDEFVDRAKKMYGNLYDYSLTEYEGSNKKVKIICNKKGHGVFSQTPAQHLLKNNKGCPICGSRKQKTTEDFVKMAKLKHKNTYDYSKSHYIKNNIPIEIICKKHGPFYQYPSNHTKGSGCPMCNNSISRREINFLDYIKLPVGKKHRQVYINRKKVDGYDPKTNTIYEFLGDYWHGNPDKYNKNDVNKKIKKTFGQLYEETFNRMNLLKQRGYSIKYIWENDWEEWKKTGGDIPIKEY